MILSETIKVKITSRNINIYKSKGYTCNINDIIEVDVYDISINSHTIIKVKCELCEKENDLKVRAYWKNYNNQNLYTCHKCSTIKRKLTCLNNYGVDNPMKSKIIHYKMIETNIHKYGVGYPLQNSNIRNKFTSTMMKSYNNQHALQCIEFVEKYRNTREKNGSWSNNISEFNTYKNIVKKLTNENKVELFENWDGYDYYDREFIKDYINEEFSANYPTIDHKISVLYGYLNKVTPEEISNIDNLCITKMYINSKKGSKCYDDFINKI